MRAVMVDRWMEPKDLVVSEIAAPSAPGPQQAQLEVHTAGCNFLDVLIVQGKYQIRPDFPFSPGGEVAGVVTAVGSEVSHLQPGDRVLSALSYGGFAEQVNVEAARTHRVPDGMSFPEAAGFSVVYGTAHVALKQRARLQPGETVLITAAAGGVGLASIQVAKALGARVIALAGGEKKLQVVRQTGADVAIDYREGDWSRAVMEATDGRGVDVVIENVGGEIFDAATRCLAWDARLVVVGFAGGTIPEIKANRILLKHISVLGLHWGPMHQHQPELIRQSFQELFELHEQGLVAPRIFLTLPIEQVAEALTALGNRETHGKVILEF